MADVSKSSKGGRGKQPPRSQFSKDTEKNLRAGERQRRANERARIRRDKERAKVDARKKREYAKELKRLEKLGLYQPKSKEITKYRAYRIRKALRENKELLSERYFFIPVSKKQKAKGIQRAADLNMITSRKGIFIEKQGFEKARLRRSAFSPKGELQIELERKIKQGQNKGKVIHEIIPLAPLDELAAAKNRLRRAANAFGPLKPNEVLAFIIDTSEEDGNIGYSYNTYEDIDLLIHDLETRYLRSDAAKIFLFRHIRIRKTTLVNGVAKDWNAEAAPFRTKKRKITKRKVKRPFRH